MFNSNMKLKPKSLITSHGSSIPHLQISFLFSFHLCVPLSSLPLCSSSAIFFFSDFLSCCLRLFLQLPPPIFANSPHNVTIVSISPTPESRDAGLLQASMHTNTQPHRLSFSNFIFIITNHTHTHTLAHTLKQLLRTDRTRNKDWIESLCWVMSDCRRDRLIHSSSEDDTLRTTSITAHMAPNGHYTGIE